MEPKSHVLVITFPAQGHINPALEFSKRLLATGIDVTFSTTITSLRKMPITTSGNQVSCGRLRFVGFSDGFDDGLDRKPDEYKESGSKIRSCGSEAARETIVTSAEQGRPVTCLVYTLLLPWAATVAREENVPCALLWIQSATVMNVYYWYFHGFQDKVTDVDSGTCHEIQLPGIVPFLTKRDVPSFLLPSSSMASVVLSLFQEQLQVLDEGDSKPKVLVNTFDALEPDAISVLGDKYDLISVGPLIPSAFFNLTDCVDKSEGADLFKESVEYIDWLNSNSQSSVVYVSFGSLFKVPKAQIEEIAKGLVQCGKPFLWVIRENNNSKEEDDEKISCLKELEKIGRIVPWCSQLKVLTHPALGCFLTHCGWNSTLESMSCGVPVVAIPQWSDQGTSAKLMEDVWQIGVRVTVDEEKGLVESDEIVRCIEAVMDRNGAKSRELRENAIKWKHLAAEALHENGSSHVNLKAFLEEYKASP